MHRSPILVSSLSAALLALSASSLVAQEPAAQVHQTEVRPTGQIEYKAKDFSHLFGMPGFGDKLLKDHFTLYAGYVKNTNLLTSILNDLAADGKQRMPPWAEIKRRFGWEFDGMRLHELYFENLGGRDPIAKSSPLYKKMVDQWGSFDGWKNDFYATGIMRGIGWAILYQDKETGQLFNIWINEHDLGHLAGGTPLLAMDVWEHAYMPQYGLDRAAYIEAFYKNIDWRVVEKRYESANPKAV